MNNIMKRVLFLFSLLLCGASLLSAQQASEGRFSMTAEAGTGLLFGQSNLSPYGVHYRGAYKGGISASVKLEWMLDRVWKAGVKYNAFETSENYGLKSGEQIADDLELHYIAPQIGFRKALGSKWRMEWTVGLGYMYYKNKSLCEETESKYTTGFLGSNMDLSFSYRLFKDFYLGVGTSLTGGRSSSLKAKTAGVRQTIDLNSRDKIKVQRSDWFLSLRAVF